MKRDMCRICQSRELLSFLDLGYSPLADRFLKDKNSIEEIFPLQAVVCTECQLVQLDYDVDDSILFGSDYGFYTGGSPSSIKYFESYAQDIIAKFPEQAKLFTVEIASNDGTLLHHFKNEGCKILGIDPARNVVSYANSHGVRTLEAFFTVKESIKIAQSEGKAGIIIANNVLAHVTDLQNFILGVKQLLADEGVFIFESQYFPYLLFNNQFDNIYHEHRSFFSLTPLLRLMRSQGMKIFYVEEHDTQGGSIRVFVSHEQAKYIVDESVEMMRKNEMLFGIHDSEIYKGFYARVNYIKVKLLTLLRDLKKQGKTIAGYGASAKSNTLLNAFGIGPDLIDYIVDKTPYKYGKFTPGSHIPIVEQIDQNPDYYLLLVWNYAEDILKREKNFREKGGKFIIPIPTPKIV